MTEAPCHTITGRFERLDLQIKIARAADVSESTRSFHSIGRSLTKLAAGSS